MRVRVLLLLLLIGVVLAGGAPSASATGLKIGFLDDVLGESPASAAPWLARAVSSESDVVRISSGWGGIAPRRPADAADPEDPVYVWSSLDQAVRNAVGVGLEPYVSLTGAPPWAEGCGQTVRFLRAPRSLEA